MVAMIDISLVLNLDYMTIDLYKWYILIQIDWLDYQLPQSSWRWADRPSEVQQYKF